MSTIVIIVLIILLLLAIAIVPFVRQMIIDSWELKRTPIYKKFEILAHIISDELMDGEGEITRFKDDPKMMNLMSPNKRNLLIRFYYSTGNLTLTLNYMFYHVELVHDEPYYGVRNIDISEQENIATQFIMICKKLIADHQEKVRNQLH